MALRLESLARSARLVCVVALTGFSLSCSRDSFVSPRAIANDAAASLGKSPTALAVTSTNPGFGDLGTTIDVHIIGSGFTAGAQATWLLHGVADPGHVHTNSTTFVSSTELVANITIASDAQLDFWDVQVALMSGKNGVGSECFEVTSAQILGPGTTGGDASVAAMNDLGQVVGTAGGSTTNGWYYDDRVGMINLGGSSAMGIDPLGALVVGINTSSFPTSWVRQTDDTWLVQPMPHSSSAVAGTARSAARTPDGTLFVAGWEDSSPTKSKSAGNVHHPVTWQRGSDGVWSNPQPYAIPSGATSVKAVDANSLEQVVGDVDGATGLVWDSPTSFTVLDALPAHINPSGTLIVGGRNNGPAVYWWRDPATHAWHTTGVALPTVAGSSCTSGLARSVNDAGVIVGWSCTPTGEKRPTVWLLDFSGPTPVLVGTPTQLPGLGAKNTAFPTSAVGLTQTAPYVVTGGAILTASSAVAVRWNLR